MGVDCEIRLPQNVKVGNVAKVIGASLGCPVRCSNFHDNSGVLTFWSAEVENIEIQGTTPRYAMVNIIIRQKTVDGEINQAIFYYFEPPFDGRLLSQRSTALWLAVGHRLVDFFGGEIDYQYFGEMEPDYSVPHKTREENSAEDDDTWDNLQERFLAIKPITEEEWRSYDQKAAYKIHGD